MTDGATDPDQPPSIEDGFTRVDAQPDPSLLTTGMELTAQWPAVRTLRAWERERLAVAAGDQVVDVGCGLGDVATELALLVAPGGEVVAIDASNAMLDLARSRVPDDRPITFRVGDAEALDLPDDSFDACRSERMLQWLDHPDRAIVEMVRVLRPGGRLVVTDTDWRTLQVDLPDVEATTATLEALHAFRGQQSRAGGRLLNLCRDADLVELDVTAVAHVWTEWDVDHDPSIPGLFPLREVLPQLVERGLLGEAMLVRFVDDVEAAARADRLCMSLTMLSVSGRVPQ
ncbi:MAG TPA: methyltransferase domain-containing protein [Microthrixaceae bacterium]|nr:methyltransferase domain-containing protein [Microthrixaceae bacterium]